MKKNKKAPVSELEDDGSPNVTKRKLVLAIIDQLEAEYKVRVKKAVSSKEEPPANDVPTQLQVLNIIQKTLDLICEAVADNKKVELRKFGVFEVKIRKARVGRNPNKPEKDVPIPARAVVKFKPGKEMREEVLKLTPKAAKAKKR